MSNIVIAMPLWSDNATLTASNEEETLPGTNLQKTQPTDLWQTQDLSNIYLELDRGSQKNFDLIALLWTNASSNATWRIRAANSQANLTAAPGLDTDSSPQMTFWASSGLTDWDRTHGMYLASSVQTYQWIRIDIFDAGNSDGVFKAGRLFISESWQSSKNDSFGREIGFLDLGSQDLMSNGSLIATQRARVNRANFSIGFLDEDEMMNNAFEIDRLRGITKDVLVVFNPDSSDSHRHKKMIHGFFTRSNPVSHPAYNIYSHEFQIQSVS